MLTKDYNRKNKSRYKIIKSTRSCKDSVQLKNIIKDREGILPYTYHANSEIKKRVHPDINKIFKTLQN